MDDICSILIFVTSLRTKRPPCPSRPLLPDVGDKGGPAAGSFFPTDAVCIHHILYSPFKRNIYVWSSLLYSVFLHPSLSISSTLICTKYHKQSHLSDLFSLFFPTRRPPSIPILSLQGYYTTSKVIRLPAANKTV